jgi:hypothetical protein
MSVVCLPCDLGLQFVLVISERMPLAEYTEPKLATLLYISHFDHNLSYPHPFPLKDRSKSLFESLSMAQPANLVATALNKAGITRGNNDSRGVVGRVAGAGGGGGRAASSSTTGMEVDRDGAGGGRPARNRKVSYNPCFCR